MFIGVFVRRQGVQPGDRGNLEAGGPKGSRAPDGGCRVTGAQHQLCLHPLESPAG